MDKDSSQSEISELIGRCVQGDEEAWQAFVSKYAKPISLYVLRSCSGPMKSEMVQDLTQEVFIRLLANDCRALRRLQATREVGLLAFLASVARTVVMDEARRRQSAKRSADIVSLDGETKGRNWTSPLSAASSPEVKFQESLGLEGFLSLLHSTITGPNAERDICIIQMYFLDEMSASEIARVPGLGVTVAAVEGVIHRARKLLRTKREFFL
jgi:RNA polymerase sigma factor (sigma-70 family)